MEEAEHIKVDGTAVIVRPKNKKAFSLLEIQAFVDGSFATIRLNDTQYLYVNEEGVLRKLPFNKRASQVADQTIVGDALLFTHTAPK